MLTVIIGGSGSGKSEYAEEFLYKTYNSQKGTEHKSSLCYIATLQPFGKEMEQKIKRHQLMRQEKNFTTLEYYTGLADISLPENAFVLVECMSNLVANEMFSEQGAKENSLKEVLKGVETLSQQATELVIVTNNVFEDGYNYDKSTMEYLRILGKINISISSQADRIIEVVHGIPLVLE